MKKSEKVPPLLDYWTPPKPPVEMEDSASIMPIGFVCTTFTFDADFFDDECLTRFLSMETEKESDGAAFLIEREDKLAGLRGGIVLVDQHHCKGGRSLRWDLVPCKVKNGILHSKVTILHWSHCIRLIVASANLTSNGYCINQEIFGVIDYYQNGEEDLKLVTEILNFVEDLAHQQCGSIVRERFDKMTNEIRLTLKNWKIRNREYARDEIWVRPFLVVPKKRNGFERLRELWEERTSSPPSSAYVTSPFFDVAESDHTPSKVLPTILKQRGDIDITYQLATEPVSETDDSIIVRALVFLKIPLGPIVPFISGRSMSMAKMRRQR